MRIQYISIGHWLLLRGQWSVEERGRPMLSSIKVRREREGRKEDGPIVGRGGVEVRDD